jgi:hypothetical protein
MARKLKYNQRIALRLKAHAIITEFLVSQGMDRETASKQAYAQVSQAPIGLVQSAIQGRAVKRTREQAMKAEQAGRIARKSNSVPYTGDLIDRLTALTDFLDKTDMEANETIDQLERA